jgi:hypothetical protein
LLLALASTVILGSESRGTHDHILQSHVSGSRATFSSFFCSKSKSLYDRRSVVQSILVPRPIRVLWPDINYWLTFTVLSPSGAPSDERSDLSFVLVIVRPLLVNIYRFTCNAHVSDVYIYTIYTRPMSVQAENSRRSLGYNGSLVF